MKTLPALLTCLFLVTVAARAQNPVTFESVSFVGDVRPGSNCVAIVNFKVAKGYSIPPGRPTLRQDLATQLFVSPPTTIRVLPTSFPAGVQKQVQLPGVAQPVTVQMYEDSFSLQVPMVIGARVMLPATLPATLAYQPQQAGVRQPVVRLAFEIKLPAAAATPPKPAK